MIHEKNRKISRHTQFPAVDDKSEDLFIVLIMTQGKTPACPLRGAAEEPIDAPHLSSL